MYFVTLCVLCHIVCSLSYCMYSVNCVFYVTLCVLCHIVCSLSHRMYSVTCVFYVTVFVLCHTVCDVSICAWYHNLCTISQCQPFYYIMQCHRIVEHQNELTDVSFLPRQVIFRAHRKNGGSGCRHAIHHMSYSCSSMLASACS